MTSTTEITAAPIVWLLVRRARNRLVGDDRDGGFAMMIALMLIFIVASLSIAIAGVVYNQVKPTLAQRKGVATVNAAAAGLQVSLDQIRTASKINSSQQTVGVLSELRCSAPQAGPPPQGARFVDDSGASVQTPGTAFAGSVNTDSNNSASGGATQYETAIAYYADDPTGQPLSWLQGHAMSCPLTDTPHFAYLQTHGTSGSLGTQQNRTLHATYTFATSNTNVAGGRLVSFGSNPAMCIDTGALEPTVGAPVSMKSCLALHTPQQSFSYRTDLTLFYQGDPSRKLCLQAPPTTGNNVTLQPCVAAATDPNDPNAVPITYPYVTGQQAQEWSFNDDGHFATAQSDGNITKVCLQPQGQMGSTQAAAGTPVQTATCEGDTSSHNAWNPDPQVGAGKAGGNTTGVPGAPTNQYVNYAEFGRCLDITGGDVTSNHLIDYPCKQAPDKSHLRFNEVWTFTPAGSGGYGSMSVVDNELSGSPTYCLTAPSSGVYIVVSKDGTGSGNCKSSPTAYQLWQPTGNLQGNYTNSYELINKQLGQCMSASSAPGGDVTPNSSNIIVETCNNTLREKWNAPPTLADTGLGNISENTGGANVG